MAASHLRSISLPSRPHPLDVCIDEHFNKLKVSLSSSIGQKLSGLKNLFECIDDLLSLPRSQQTVSHDRQSQCAENVLNGSLELLDMCDKTRNFFSQMKECLQELESSLRRRKSGDSGFTSEVDAYMVSRKKLNKVICKYARNLKRKERNCMTALDDNSNMISRLRNVEEIGLSVFQSILSFISQPKEISKSSSWSIISKLLHISSEVEVEVNEVEKIDAELAILKSSKDINFLQFQNVMKGLEALQSSIQEAVEELECIYRQLVKCRAFLLNILNP